MGRHTAPVPVQPTPETRGALRAQRDSTHRSKTDGAPRSAAEAAVRDIRLPRSTAAQLPIRGSGPQRPPAVEPRAASGTAAAAPPTDPVPVISAPSLSTAPLTAPSRPVRQRAVGRWAALAAGVVIAGSVAAQVAAPRLSADAAAAPAVSSSSTIDGTPADSATSGADPSASSSPSAQAPTEDVESWGDGFDGPALPQPTDEPGDPLTAVSAGPGDDPDGARSSIAPTPSRSDDVSDPAPSNGSPTSTSTSDPPPPSSTPSGSATLDPTPSTPSSSKPPSSESTPPSASSGSRPTSAPPAETAPALRTGIARTPQGGVVQLATGVYAVRDFGTDLNAADLERRGLHGAGSGRTVVTMARRSSSKSGAVPTHPYSTNQLYLLSTIGGTPGLSGFTLRATDQGHLFNGLRIGKATGVHVTDVRVEDVPGDAASPPGETFAINDWRTTGSVYRRIVVDSGGVGAAGFGANSSLDLTIEDSTFTGTASSSGAAIWQTRGITMNDVRIVDNRSGINFERSGGRIVLNRPVFRGNRLYDMQFGTDMAGGTVTVNDPVLAPGQKLVLNVPAKYHGHANGQRRSAIHVLVHGVDRTADLVRWR